MRYLVRERLFDFKEDFWVTDERGDRVFYARSKLVSLHHTLVLEDARGHKLASIKHKLLTFLDSMNIEHDGRVVATVHRAVFSPLHHRSIIELHDEGIKLEAVGNIIDKDFEVRYGRHAVARISRKWFRLRDTYGVDVAPGQNDALMIAIAICLDRIHHDEQERSLSGSLALAAEPYPWGASWPGMAYGPPRLRRVGFWSSGRSRSGSAASTAAAYTSASS